MIFNLIFILREIRHGFLNSGFHLLRTASWMLVPHYFSDTWCYRLSYIAIIDNFPPLFSEERHFPFPPPSFTPTFLFVVWTPLSHFFLHFQLIFYTYVPHVCFNSRSLTRVHLFHFMFVPPKMNFLRCFYQFGMLSLCFLPAQFFACIQIQYFNSPFKFPSKRHYRPPTPICHL